MSLAKPILAGGAAAAIIAGAAYLFPVFDSVKGVTRADDAEFALGTSAFAALIGGETGGLAGLEKLGFGAGTLAGADHTMLLSEAEGECAGRGIYLIRSQATDKLALTAPHRGSDRHTGTLASALFLETGAQAAAWNSGPRRATSKCEHAIDLARERNHLFSAFALGFAEAAPDGLIVQLHGFDGDRRESLAAREAGIILSNGSEAPSARLLDLADCLSLAFAPIPVLVYPGDTGELGALSNAQGQLLREAGFDGFVHMEISAELRAALIEDDALRGKLATCLAEAAA
ncbi:MAG: hypothetical protein AAGL68_00315 [Pseudomonadota bacterium]